MKLVPLILATMLAFPMAAIADSFLTNPAPPEAHYIPQGARNTFVTRQDGIILIGYQTELTPEQVYTFSIEELAKDGWRVGSSMRAAKGTIYLLNHDPSQGGMLALNSENGSITVLLTLDQ